MRSGEETRRGEREDEMRRGDEKRGKQMRGEKTDLIVSDSSHSGL